MKPWGGIFDLGSKRTRLAELDQRSQEADFWNDNDAAQTVLKERAQLFAALEQNDKLNQKLDDSEVLLELFAESKDSSLLAEGATELAAVEETLAKLELARMLSGSHDKQDAILEINSGAGGTEAQDWGEMLLRMYLRWIERKGFQAELLSIHPGEEAGIKNASLLVHGENAFGYLRSERGVHRLVRISPFDANARRHTSFASVGVIPDIDDDVPVEINEDDLRIDTYRSSGAGGQHVNKTDSAVRLTHLPTGIVVACQNERSQHKNKAMAMKILRAKLYELEEEKKREKLEKLAGERRKIDFGSQIRSYVLQPYQLIKDLRTDYETGNVQAVLDGDLDRFIEAYLMSDDGQMEKE